LLAREKRVDGDIDDVTEGKEEKERKITLQCIKKRELPCLVEDCAVFTDREAMFFGKKSIWVKKRAIGGGQGKSERSTLRPTADGGENADGSVGGRHGCQLRRRKILQPPSAGYEERGAFLFR